MEATQRFLHEPSEGSSFNLLNVYAVAHPRRDGWVGGRLKISVVKPEFHDIIPDQLAEGVLYISERYHTAIHKCCCGCGNEVVTPLTPADWSLRKSRDTVTLYPSVGNWAFACQSHYWIRANHVVWARAFSKAQIARVRMRDKADKDAYIKHANRKKELDSVEHTSSHLVKESPTVENVFVRWWNLLR